MADTIKITTFGVGQGLCNLIEIYEQDTGRMAYLALADCGSTSKVKENKTTYVENVEDMFQYVIQKACERWEKDKNYYFDAVFLSHQDADHWNLMLEVFSRLLCLAKGERISIKDEHGICTQYLLRNTNEENEIFVCSYKKDGSSDIWNVSRDMESNEGQYRSSSYGRTWRYENSPIFSDYEYIEITYSDEEREGIVRGTHRIKDESISIEYTTEDDEGDKEEAFYLNDKDNHYIIYQKEKKNYTPGEIDIITALKAFLKVIPQNAFAQGMYNLLEANEGINLDFVQSSIQSGQTVKKAIHTVYFGGFDYGSQATSFKAKLSNMAENIVTSIEESAQICDDRIRFHIISPFPACIIYDSNIYKKRVPIGINRNRTSLFVIIYYLENMIILPGDATFHAMKSFCFLADKRYIAITGRTEFLVAPHHGSDTTSTDGQPGYKTLREFLRRIKAKSIAISSGIDNRHHHPGENFIIKAMEVTSPAKGHNVYVYTQTDGYTYAKIGKDIRTTVVDDKYCDIIFNSPPVVSEKPAGREVRGNPFRELPRKDLFV